MSTITAGAPTIRGNSVRDYYHHDLAGGGLTNDVVSLRRLDRATLEKSENSSANVEKMAYKMAYRKEKRARRRVFTGSLAEAVSVELRVKNMAIFHFPHIRTHIKETAA